MISEKSPEERGFRVQLHFSSNAGRDRETRSYLSRWEKPTQSDGLVTVDGANPQWISHSRDEVDLCAFDMAALLEEVSEKLAARGKHVVCRLLNTSEYPMAGGVKLLNIRHLPIGPGSDVFMLGYPNGVEGPHGLPLYRRGTLSTDQRVGARVASHKKPLKD